MKRMIAFLCAVVLIFSFAGCSGKVTSSSKTLSTGGSGSGTSSVESTDGVELIDPTATESSQDGSGDATSAQNSGSSSKSSGGTGTVSSGPSKTYTLDTTQEKKFASIRGTTATVYGNPESVDTQDRVKMMKHKYGVTIKLVNMNSKEMQQKIAGMVAARNTPDLLPFTDVVAMRYVYSNIAQPLDNYLIKNDPMWSYHGRSLLHNISGKTYWASSYDDQGWYVYYNKTYFNELKLKEPYEYYKEGTWNFENFRKVAKDATRSTGGITETFGVMTWSPLVFLLANGATGVVQSGGKWSIKLSDKAAMAGMQLVRDLSADGSFSLTHGGLELSRRQTAMVIGPPANTIYSNDLYNRMKDEIGMVPLPKGPDVSTYYTPVSTDGFFVPMYAKNPLAGIAYLYEREKFNYNIMEVSNAPKDIAYRNKLMSKEHRAIRDEYMKNAIPIFSHLDGLANWWDGENNRRIFWNKLVKDKSNPAQVIDSMNSIVLSCLKKTVGSTNVK